MVQFQSLLFWIGLLDVVTDLPSNSRVWFQSLLFWIGLLDPRPGVAIRMGRRVSILVILDRPLGLRDSGIGSSHPVMFQSLLFWIGLLDLFSGRGDRGKMG